MLSTLSIYPKITYPTRFSDHKATLIDNIFSKLSQLSIRSTAGMSLKQFSDHQPCFISIPLEKHHTHIKYVILEQNQKSLSLKSIMR